MLLFLSAVLWHPALGLQVSFGGDGGSYSLGTDLDTSASLVAGAVAYKDGISAHLEARGDNQNSILQSVNGGQSLVQSAVIGSGGIDVSSSSFASGGAAGIGQSAWGGGDASVSLESSKDGEVSIQQASVKSGVLSSEQSGFAGGAVYSSQDSIIVGSSGMVESLALSKDNAVLASGSFEGLGVLQMASEASGQRRGQGQRGHSHGRRAVAEWGCNGRGGEPGPEPAVRQDLA
jgi:hypothetical protein